MKHNNCSELLATLREIHAVAAEYRLGQLVCNLAVRVGDGEVVCPWEAGDEELLAAGRRFLESQRRLGREAPLVDDRWPELLVKVRRLGEEYPGVRFGEMVRYLAVAARGPEPGNGAGGGAMWDVEDEELIAVADRWLAHSREQHEAEAAVRRLIKRSGVE